MEKMNENNILEETVNEEVNENMGDGTRDNPFVIVDAASFAGICNNLSAFYRLGSDIDFHGGSPGTEGTVFTGGLNGSGYVLRNLKVEGTSIVGIFKETTNAEIENLTVEGAETVASSYYAGILAGKMNGGTVTNVILKDCRITGGKYTGGIAGKVFGIHARGCYVKGNVNGQDYTGGLFGEADNAVIIAESHADIEVKGNTYIGGLLGGGGNELENSYAEGSVISTTQKSQTGGLVGYGSSLKVKNCYAACEVSVGGKGLVYSVSMTENCLFDAQVTGWGTQDIRNTGKLTAAFLRKETFPGWDFENTWKMEEGKTRPYLREENRKEVVLTCIVEGLGTDEEPYRLKVASDFSGIQYERSGKYRLENDIDFEGGTPGTVGIMFSGALDGNGHILQNFRVEGDFLVGFFKEINNAVIHDLIVKRSEVVGNDCVGILAGRSYGGTVVKVAVKGCQVTGKNRAGGITGGSDGASTISMSCAEVEVTGEEKLGGLLGDGYGNLENSYAEGKIISTTKSRYAGGLVGNGSSLKIKNCYAACEISEGGKGITSYAPVMENCFYDAQVVGYGTEGNSIGKLTVALLHKETFLNWDFENIWKIDEGKTRPYLWDGDGKKVVPVHIKKGTGTEDDPYVIKTEEDFRKIALERSGKYRLENDLDFGGEAPGTEGTLLTGGLDGNGHVISNFRVEGRVYTGLFQRINGSVICNLTIQGAEVIGGTMGTGILTGEFVNGAVSNVALKDCRVTGENYTGGLAGRAAGTSIIGCYVKGSISGQQYTGGLLGRMDKIVTITETYTDIEVIGSSYVGGLMGEGFGKLENNYAHGEVKSTTNDLRTGGLIGSCAGMTMKNCYAACKISAGGKGLTYIYSNATVINSFFDSELSGIVSPTDQARTTEQMYSGQTYTGWDMDTIWHHEEGSYPALRRIQLICQEPFDLFVCNITGSSVKIKWDKIANIEEYIVFTSDQAIETSDLEIILDDLIPDTVYEFRVAARIDQTACVYSKVLTVKTRGILEVSGIHCTEKEGNELILNWDSVDGAVEYEVTYNGNRRVTTVNECVLPDLEADTVYMISVNALYGDGSSIKGKPIVKKIFTVNPQTDYAKEFVSKCEGQRWFIDEIENLLNRRGKTVNAIKGQRDFAAIYALCVENRGVYGRIPRAIGELSQLRYLFLTDNHLEGPLPAEFEKLTLLVDQDLSGNNF